MSKAKAAIVKAVRRAAALEIDGEKYELVYDFNAIAEAETLCGCNLLHGISAMFLNTMTALQLRGILYASLQPLQPGFSMDRIGQMIRIDTMPSIYKAIADAWSLSMPAAEKEKSENPPVADEPPAGD